jgi:hypothetical protein
VKGPRSLHTQHLLNGSQLVGGVTQLAVPIPLHAFHRRNRRLTWPVGRSDALSSCQKCIVGRCGVPTPVVSRAVTTSISASIGRSPGLAKPTRRRRSYCRLHEVWLNIAETEERAAPLAGGVGRAHGKILRGHLKRLLDKEDRLPLVGPRLQHIFFEVSQ